MNIFIITLSIIATLFSKSIELQMADSMLISELYDSELYLFSDNYFQSDDSVDQNYNVYLKSQISTPLDTSLGRTVRRKIRTFASSKIFSGRISFSDNSQNRLLISEWSTFSNFGSKNISLTCGTFKQSLGLGLLVGGAKRSISRKESDTLSLKGSLYNTLGSQSNGLLFKYKGKIAASLSYSWNEKTIVFSIGHSSKKLFNQLILCNDGAAYHLSTKPLRQFSSSLECAINKGGIATAIVQEYTAKKIAAKLTAWVMSDSFPIASSRGPTLHQGWHIVHTDKEDTVDVRRPGESGFKIATSLALPLLNLKMESGMSTIPQLLRSRRVLNLYQQFVHYKFTFEATERFRQDNAPYGEYLTSSLDMNMQYAQSNKWSYRAGYGTLLYSNKKENIYQLDAMTIFTHRNLEVGIGPSFYVSNRQWKPGIQIHESVTFANTGKLKILYNSIPTTELRANIEWNM